MKATQTTNSRMAMKAVKAETTAQAENNSTGRKQQQRQNATAQAESNSKGRKQQQRQKATAQAASNSKGRSNSTGRKQQQRQKATARAECNSKGRHSSTDRNSCAYLQPSAWLSPSPSPLRSEHHLEALHACPASPRARSPQSRAHVHTHPFSSRQPRP